MLDLRGEGIHDLWINRDFRVESFGFFEVMWLDYDENRKLELDGFMFLG